MGGTFILTAASSFATSFIPADYSWATLLSFVVGRGAITIAFVVIYLYTIEQWPTPIRNTMTNTCSMIGRIGSMVRITNYY